jgi:hypothetical protein
MLSRSNDWPATTSPSQGRPVNPLLDLVSSAGSTVAESKRRPDNRVPFTCEEVTEMRQVSSLAINRSARKKHQSDVPTRAPQLTNLFCWSVSISPAPLISQVTLIIHESIQIFEFHSMFYKFENDLMSCATLGGFKVRIKHHFLHAPKTDAFGIFIATFSISFDYPIPKFLALFLWA